MKREIKISEFDYLLPDDRIAKFPVAQRDGSKLLIYRDGIVTQSVFREIGRELPEGAMLVFNNTKVIRARIIMYKPSGARIEIFCLEPYTPADYERAFAVRESCEWLCIIGNLKKWKGGPLAIEFEYEGAAYKLEAQLGERHGNEHIVMFRWNADMTFGQLLEHLGRLPIPPYLGRDSEESDNTRYQTVYSRIEGSVAAPTAGLHFTEDLIGEMRNNGFGFSEITLHVGAGTFLPVKEEDVKEHSMHTEHFEISVSMIKRLIANKGKIIPVGTTSVRTLESLPVLGYRIMRSGDPHAGATVGQWEAYAIPEELNDTELLSKLADYMESNGTDILKASTQIMIMPGFRYRITNGLITNFHQPKSTLLLLVSALIGEDWRRVYDYALENDFRFLSYGDSSVLLPK